MRGAAALRSDRGASRKLLERTFDGKLETVASVALMLEYQAVLTRAKHLAATALTRDETSAGWTVRGSGRTRAAQFPVETPIDRSRGRDGFGGGGERARVDGDQAQCEGVT